MSVSSVPSFLSSPWLRIKRNLQVKNGWEEVSGALGDLGTFIPIVITLTLVNHLDLGTTLLFTGAYNIITGQLDIMLFSQNYSQNSQALHIHFYCQMDSEERSSAEFFVSLCQVLGQTQKTISEIFLSLQFHTYLCFFTATIGYFGFIKYWTLRRVTRVFLRS